MDRQEVFDRVSVHLLTQHKRSHRRNRNRSLLCAPSSCLYRGPRGLKCAIGCLIPDDIYTPDIEHDDVYGIEPVLIESGINTDKKTMDLLRHLQVIHDEDHPQMWRRKLTALAIVLDLATTAINKVPPKRGDATCG